MFFFLQIFNLSFCDAPTPWQLNIQDPASPSAEGIIYFHNVLMTLIIVITVLVLWFLLTIYLKFNADTNSVKNVQKFSHASLLEIVWTVFPAIVLVFVAIPSFTLLYSLDEIIDPTMTLKIVGHQWYWSYEYSDFSDTDKSVNFDSYMITTNDLTLGAFRLLETDNRVVLPTNTHIRLLITSADVLHCWAVPSFGIKVDACPGRLSQASLFVKREGLFFGQCSEICGINHGFMPIAVKCVNVDNFVSWISTKLED